MSTAEQTVAIAEVAEASPQHSRDQQQAYYLSWRMALMAMARRAEELTGKSVDPANFCALVHHAFGSTYIARWSEAILAMTVDLACTEVEKSCSYCGTAASGTVDQLRRAGWDSFLSWRCPECCLPEVKR